MAIRFKYKNENYLDSTGIVHNKELLSDVLKRNIITARLSADQTATASRQTINFNKFDVIGSKLTYSENSVVVGKGVSYVLISGNVSAKWNSPQANDFLLYVTVNGTLVKRVDGHKVDSGMSIAVTASPFLCAVSEGDVIKMDLYATPTNSIIDSNTGATSMTVEVVG